MSIALSVVVAPSRRLRLLAGGFGASLLGAALAVGAPAPLRFTAETVVAAALLFAGLCLLHAALRPAMVHRIDISGVGRIRLTVQQDLRPEAAGGTHVALLPGSTLWPRLMLLRFGPVGAVDEPGMGGAGLLQRWRAGPCVVVLPDSVAPEAFRALAVALGAVAGQGGAPAIEHEIL
ncbi:hypothetical protein LQ564_25255 [Massilia sp. G4R7]|uniref:PH domain-containing protein n=1 Tax=Massilia phyllostachyos TaxID=2898585 RepID=A0ABS8QCY7_9BURK|nr:hypothetical protein [Massilia phyllostachyos]MCD2519617.1 hypothetical protein [Massilia phyllostachyos]